MDLGLWGVAAQIVCSVLFGAAVTYRLQRPRLIAYYGHVAAHAVDQSNGPQARFHTHSVIIKNTGWAAAHHVRATHGGLVSNVFVYPDVPHRKDALPNGTEDLVFDVLVPGQQIEISYVYGPHVTFNQITQQIRSDEGMAKFMPAQITPQLQGWRRNLVICLFFLGCITTLYFGFFALRWIISVSGLL